jgi:hypothetical protein
MAVELSRDCPYPAVLHVTVCVAASALLFTLRVGGVSDPYGRVITMSSSELPQPMLDAAQRAAVAVSQLEPMRAAIEAVGRVAAEQATALSAVIAAQDQRLGRHWAEQVTQALASAEMIWRPQVYRAAEAVARTVQQHRQALDRMELSFDVTGLARVLHDMEEWRALTDQQRAAAIAATQEAWAAASEDDVPQDLMAELEGTVRDLVETETEFLPLEVSRQTFALFVGAVVLLSLMTVSFSSDTADGVLTKAVELSLLAGIAMAAAGKFWDRCNGVEDGNEDEQAN